MAQENLTMQHYTLLCEGRHRDGAECFNSSHFCREVENRQRDLILNLFSKIAAPKTCQLPRL